MAKRKNNESTEGQLTLDSLFFPEEKNEEQDQLSMAEVGPEVPIKPSEEYWAKCVQMLASWGAYVGRQDLLDNASNDQTRFKVWHIVEETFGGSLGRLKNRVNTLEREFVVDYDVYVKACGEYGVEAVSRKWMRSHLWDGADIQSYRGRCRTREAKADKYPAEPLKDFPPRQPKKGGKKC